jgi:uncharacterized damage-inducible protein DinB
MDTATMDVPTLLAAYEAGSVHLAETVAGLSPADLLRRPPAELQIGLWSIHQVVIHLADCETVFADRMKRVIAEENPPLAAFDENLWMSRLACEQQSCADALELIRLTRRQLAIILRRLPAADFQRAGMHTKTGRQTLENLVRKAVWHLEHHLEFIRRKRQWLSGRGGNGGAKA